MGEASGYPRLFGKYLLVAPLAQGGMGELHLALVGDADNKKLCVLKQISSQLADAEFVRRFLDEAKLVVKLSHGNLVPVFESGTYDSHHFLAMEYIEGCDLRALWNELQARRASLPMPLALHIVRELCRGLAYAHGFGNLQLVHRDISPPNILISFDGEVRVTDFGLAQSRLKMEKTSPGLLLGKLAYMAPEQARNEAISAQTDIYALGIILWELLTEQRFFAPWGSQLERLQRVANPTFERPSKHRRAIPAAVDRICERALAKAPGDRYADAEEMRRDLASAIASVAPTTDASALADLLNEIFGETRETARDERMAQIEAAEQALPALQSAANARPSAGELPRWPSADDSAAPGEADAPEGAQPHLPAGTILSDRYRIESMIREGGMGTVYLATHLGIDRKVAVKVLHPVYSRSPEVVTRFRHEARAASRIGHPNIIEIFDSGETAEGAIYFAMEHLVGQDLADLLDHSHILPVERTITIGIQICQALAAAHEAGIVHRDLKPENIFLVAKEGQIDFVKILDFGIAQSSHLDATRKERLTLPGTAMGTPEYMAPEQAAGKACDHRADIYAVGALLYEMLSGSPPHQGENMLEILSKKANEPVRPLGEVCPHLPDPLQQAVMWALAEDPEMRPQASSHLAYELTKLRSGRAGAIASMLGFADLAPLAQTAEQRTLSPLSLTPEAPNDSRSNSDTPLRDEFEAAPPHESVAFIPATEAASSTKPSGQDALGATATLPALRSPGRRRWVGVATGVGTLFLGALIAAFYFGVLWGPRVSVPRLGTQAGAVEGGILPSPRPTVEAKPPSTGGAGPPSPAIHRGTQGGTALPATAPGEERLPQRPATAAPSAQRASAEDEAGPSSHSAGPTGTGRPQRMLRSARARLKEGRFAQAKRAFVRASHLPGTRSRALLGLAELAFQQRRFAAAARYARQARQSGSGWRADLALGNALFKQGHHQQAAGNYRRVLQAAPQNPEARRNLDAALKRLKSAKRPNL